MGLGSGPPPTRRMSAMASVTAGAAKNVYIEMTDGSLVKALIMNLSVEYERGYTGYMPDDFRAGTLRTPGQPMRVKLEAIVIEDYGVRPEADKRELVLQAMAREQRAKKTGVSVATPPPPPPKPEPKSATVRRFADLEPIAKPEKK